MKKKKTTAAVTISVSFVDSWCESFLRLKYISSKRFKCFGGNNNSTKRQKKRNIIHTYWCFNLLQTHTGATDNGCVCASGARKLVNVHWPHLYVLQFLMDWSLFVFGTDDNSNVVVQHSRCENWHKVAKTTNFAGASRRQSSTDTIT